MLIRKRVDGTLVKVPIYTRVIPMLMPKRTEATVYADSTLNVEDTIRFVRAWNKAAPKGDFRLSLMQVILCAVARVSVEYPAINRFVSNFRYYQRNNVSVSFVAKKKLNIDGKETNVTMPFKPNDNLASVNRRFAFCIKRAFSDDGNKSENDLKIFAYLPVFVIRLFVWITRFLDKHNWIPAGLMRMFPFYSSFFLTNVGSVGLDAPYHHNYEMGNCGIFLSIGKIQHDEGSGNRESKSSPQPRNSRILLRYTFDERIVDGLYSGRAMNRIKYYVENPESLVESPEISPEQFQELKLSQKGWELWNQNSDESFTSQKP